MSRSIIHIGANKTGSTTLQRCLFARSDELVYLGEDCENYGKVNEILSSVVSDDDIHYDRQAAAKLFKQFLSSKGQNLTAIYSNEDIMSSRVPTLCAKRLRELMPEAQILMIIRNQLTAIPSWYANHGAYLRNVPRCYWRRYVPFNDWMGYCTEFIKYSPLDIFFYYRIAKLYSSVFGKEKIHILFYEDFVKNKEGFIKDLSEILGIDSRNTYELLGDKRERKRNTMRMYRYHQFRNWFFWGRDFSWILPGETLKRMWQRWLEGGPLAGGFMSDYWRDRIIGLYKEDNSQLAKEYNLPLKEYNYPVT